MKNYKLTIIGLILIGMNLTGCGPSENDSADSKKSNGFESETIGAFGYNFSGKDDSGIECTTGEVTPSNHHQMCLQLQNEALNNNCAVEKRIRRFERDCLPHGYANKGSRECRLVVLNRNADISLSNPLVKNDILAEKSFCVGETLKGQPTKNLNVDVALFDKYRVSAELYFDKNSRTQYLKKKSNIRLFIYSRDEQLKATVEKRVNYNDGIHTTFGPTRDGQYQLAVECYQTSYCEGSQ